MTTRKDILGSAAWTMAERIFTLAALFVSSIFVANHLGADGWGEFNFALSLVALCTAFASAGLSGLVVKDLVRKHEERFEILGTVFVVRLMASIVAFAILTTLAFVVDIGSSQTHILILIIGIGACMRSMDVVDFWFQSQTKMRSVSIANAGATFVGVVVKLTLVFLDAPLVAFAWTMAIESVAVSTFLLIFYIRNVGSPLQWKFKKGLAGDYLKKSWPLIVSGTLNTVNMRVDIVLLGIIAGAASAGTYAVAARLSEVWYFLPTAIVGSAFASIIKGKDISEAVYRRRLRRLYGVLAWGAISIAAIITVVAQPLINALYDPAFSAAASVLIIHVWTAPFLFMGVVFSRWLIVENLLMTSLMRHGLGAAVNIGLNIWLIPIYGAKGSACATLASYIIATYGVSFLSKTTRPAAIDMTYGLLMPITEARTLFRRRFVKPVVT